MILDILKVILKIGFIVPVYWGIVALLTSAITAVMISHNTGVLNDIFALVQLWLPFNLNVILVWISTSIVLYLTYAISLMMLNLINTWFNTK